MGFSSVRLVPGTNVERTPTLLEAGYSQTQLIRFKDSLAQKYGGWSKFYASTVTGIPRDFHAWEDLSSFVHLGVGTTGTGSILGVITSGVLRNITPQTQISDFAPNFSTVINTPTVTIVDPNLTNTNINNSVFFNTPITVGGIILSGLYPIASIISGTSYTITAAKNATATVSNAGAVPGFLFTNIGPNTVVVTVTFPNHGLSVGSVVAFAISSTNGVNTIPAQIYTVGSILSANQFTITSPTPYPPLSPPPALFFMNGGNAELVYYQTIIPPSTQSGSAITASDWTEDNWGQLLIAVPQNGGIYVYNPTSGFSNATFVGTAPPFNGGAFVSNAQQILICWASTGNYDIGQAQDPLLVRWSNSGDYTNFVVTSTTQAGSFRIPSGSVIRGGMSVANQNLIWTDLDLWAMTYIGVPFVYGFTKVGAGAGAIGSHAIQALRGNVYWMGQTNFYQATSNGAQVIPCPVWDAVFQNLDTANSYKVRAMPNTPFNEVGWLYPSASGGTGECDSYVKMNITEPGNPWDYGSIGRSAWIDQTVLGMPISGTTGGVVYSQETTNDADGSALAASFTTGYFMIGEGEEFAFVDQIYPDFKFGTYAASPNAQIQISFNVTDYPGDTPITYGPYTFTSTTEYIAVRFRGRQMSITVTSSDLGSWWRLGRVRYRWSPVGRR